MRVLDERVDVVLERVGRGRPERSIMLTGLRGVGKTVLATLGAVSGHVLVHNGQPGTFHLAGASGDTDTATGLLQSVPTGSGTQRVLADDRIKAIFDESNIDRLRAEFKVQFCQVAGGGCDYKGHNMTAAHKGLHLDNADFNAVVEDLQLAMDKVGLPFTTQNRFLARLAPMQHQVVSR